MKKKSKKTKDINPTSNTQRYQPTTSTANMDFKQLNELVERLTKDNERLTKDNERLTKDNERLTKENTELKKQLNPEIPKIPEERGFFLKIIEQNPEDFFYKHFSCYSEEYKKEVIEECEQIIVSGAFWPDEPLLFLGETGESMIQDKVNLIPPGLTREEELKFLGYDVNNKIVKELLVYNDIPLGERKESKKIITKDWCGRKVISGEMDNLWMMWYEKNIYPGRPVDYYNYVSHF